MAMRKPSRCARLRPVAAAAAVLDRASRAGPVGGDRFRRAAGRRSERRCRRHRRRGDVRRRQRRHRLSEAGRQSEPRLAVQFRAAHGAPRNASTSARGSTRAGRGSGRATAAASSSPGRTSSGLKATACSRRASIPGRPGSSPRSRSTSTSATRRRPIPTWRWPGGPGLSHLPGDHGQQHGEPARICRRRHPRRPLQRPPLVGARCPDGPQHRLSRPPADARELAAGRNRRAGRRRGRLAGARRRIRRQGLGPPPFRRKRRHPLQVVPPPGKARRCEGRRTPSPSTSPASARRRSPCASCPARRAGSTRLASSSTRPRTSSPNWPVPLGRRISPTAARARPRRAERGRGPARPLRHCLRGGPVDSDRLRQRRRGEHGGPHRRGASEIEGEPLVDVAETGAAVVAWRELRAGTGLVAVQERRADGVVEPTELSAPNGGGVGSVAMGGSGLGDAIVTWKQGNGANGQIAAAVVDAPPDPFLILLPEGWQRRDKIQVAWDRTRNAIGGNPLHRQRRRRAGYRRAARDPARLTPDDVEDGRHRVQVFRRRRRRAGNRKPDRAPARR